MKHKNTLLLLSLLIGLLSQPALAQSYTSPNYTLSHPAIVISGGQANSHSYYLNYVTVGDIFGGRAQGPNYSLDATIQKNLALDTPIVDEGVLIGPAGGEVLSQDGRVKIIIPPGALDEPTWINIVTIDEEELSDLAPENRDLLSVVECQPPGLIFNKTAEMIYYLARSEVPGTPVELGLYDSTQDQISLTGKVSPVAIDGCTVSFSIGHFSTYAALKDLTPQGIPIGAGVKIPLPDMFTGAFSHSISLTLPPGRCGMQPNLSLSYNSSRLNSWVGLGFSLSPGYITRSTRLGLPSYDDSQDTFYFVNQNGTTELLNLTGNLYQARIESDFTKFFKQTGDSWQAVGKDGLVLYFGQSLSSKETSPEGTYTWYLTKAQGPNGNYIEYHYTQDQGKSYLSRIEYTGNEIGISPTNTVEFILEARSDKSSSYVSGSEISTNLRLGEVQVKVAGELVWKYLLDYTYSADTNRSLLRSITQYGASGEAFPSQTFRYQSAEE